MNNYTVENLFLLKAYEYLENVTPLTFDCGKLCNSACCNGGEKDGMILFPGEKEIFENIPGFNVYFDKNYGKYAISCNGICERNFRPLSCRIYPYMFYCKNDDTISVAPDIRALGECKLLDANLSVNPDFMRKMRMLAILAQQDRKISNFIKEMTLIITDFGKLDF